MVPSPPADQRFDTPPRADHPGVDHSRHRGLDGLRGVGVAGVVAFHLGRLPGGFLGVDLFFVLSGFLITRLVLDGAHNSPGGRVDLAKFWTRRARRLLPAVFAFVAASGVLAWWFADRTELTRLRRDGLATLAYAVNWVQIVAGDGYWERFGRPSWFRHLWSLAIEEQFYLLWPLVLWWIAARTPRHRRASRVVAAALIGAALSTLLGVVLFHPARFNRLYLGTDARVVAPLMGAAFGALVGYRRWTPRFEGDVAVSGAVAALAVAWCAPPDSGTWLFRGGLAAVAIASGVVIVGVATDAAPGWAGVLGAPPLAALGRISYSLYLWHWPIILLLDRQSTGLSGWSLDGLRVGVSLVVASLSFALIEQPVRTGRVPVRVLGAGGAAALLLAGAVLVVGTGATARSATRERRSVDTALRATTGLPKGARILVTGDSVGSVVGQAMSALGDAAGFEVGNAALPSCPIARTGARTRGRGFDRVDPPGCAEYPRIWKRMADRLDPTLAVMVLGLGFNDGEREVAPGRWSHPCEPEYEHWFTSELTVALQTLGELAPEVAVTTVAPYGGMLAERVHDRDGSCANRAIRAAARAVPGVKVVDLGGWYCPDGRCREDLTPGPDRPDGLHYSIGAAIEVSRWLLGQLT